MALLPNTFGRFQLFPFIFLKLYRWAANEKVHKLNLGGETDNKKDNKMVIACSKRIRSGIPIFQ